MSFAGRYFRRKPSVTSFESLGLLPELLRAVAEHGYTEPTPIQSQAIPIVLSGRDLLGAAQTGTGKTAGFTLPLLQRLAPLATQELLARRCTRCAASSSRPRASSRSRFTRA